MIHLEKDDESGNSCGVYPMALEDDASFRSQRRNVMWLSTLMIFAKLVGAKASSFVIFSIKPLRPEVIPWVLLIVLIYFVWRFYQTSRHEGKSNEMWDTYGTAVQTTLNQLGTRAADSELQDHGVAEARRNNTEPKDGKYIVNVTTSNVTITPFVIAKSGAQLRVPFNGGVSWKDEKGGVYSINRPNGMTTVKISLWRLYKLRLRALVSTVLRTVVFTEFVLPYLLAIVAVVIYL